MIESETAHLLKKIIQQNRERGIPEETMQSHQEELVATAKQRAEESVRLRFLLDQIAQKENIAITPEEFHQEIALLSQRYQMPVEKLIKELKKNNALGGIQEELLFSKTLQWLIDHAVVKELLATSSAEDDSHDLGHVHGPHCHH